MGYLNHVPIPSNLIICFYSFLSLVAALHSYPHPSIYPPLLLQSNIKLNATLPPSNLTTPNPIPPPHMARLDCFNATSQRAFPVDPDDCRNAIDLILRDPSGVMTSQTYSWHARIPGSFGVPADWHDGHCSILLTTGLLDAVDVFKLVEVIVVVQRILDECVPISKTSLGGLALVGNLQGFFVAVNGPEPEDVDEMT